MAFFVYFLYQHKLGMTFIIEKATAEKWCNISLVQNIYMIEILFQCYVFYLSGMQKYSLMNKH